MTSTIFPKNNIPIKNTKKKREKKKRERKKEKLSGETSGRRSQRHNLETIFLKSANDSPFKQVLQNGTRRALGESQVFYPFQKGPLFSFFPPQKKREVVNNFSTKIGGAGDGKKWGLFFLA